MENGGKLDSNSIKSEYMNLTANEVTNVLGMNYKTIAKILNTLATKGEIEVTEKVFNNRSFKAYKLSIIDLQNIKNSYNKGKHLENDKNNNVLQMLANASITKEIEEKTEKSIEDISVKFYEVSNKNIELTKEIDKLKQDIQTKTNENVRLDADLSMAKSELKFITDKSASMESAYSEKKLEVERLQKVVKSRNIALIVLGAIVLVGATVVIMLMLLGAK